MTNGSVGKPSGQNDDPRFLIYVCGGVVLWTLIGMALVDGSVVNVLEGRKDSFGSIQSIATTVGIVLAAWWFLLRRQRYPRADISNTITHRDLPDGRIWIHVRTDIINKGNVLIRVAAADTWIQQVVPLPEPISRKLARSEELVDEQSTEIQWNALAQRERCPGNEIEPEESDYIAWDFIVDEGPSTVRVYTHITNESKRRRGPIGWSTETIYDLTAGTPMGR